MHGMKSEKEPKTADSVISEYYGRLFKDHLRLNKYFSKQFAYSCSVFQTIIFDMQHAYVLKILVFVLTRRITPALLLLQIIKFLIKFHKI